MSKLIGPNRRLTNALESIANVAEVFEILELEDAAEATTSLLESVVASIEKMAAPKKKTTKKKTPSKKSRKQVSVNKNPIKPLVIIEEEEDPFTKNLNSVKQLENIRTVGWPFNAPQIINKDEEDCMNCNDYSWLDDNDVDYGWIDDNTENYVKDFDLDEPEEDETYYGSAKNKKISRERAIEEILEHNADPREFISENGHKSHYKAQDVLNWLGY